MSLLFGLLLCLPLLVVCQAPDLYAFADDMFTKIDTNRDSIIVIRELEHFLQNYDDDGDGRVSRTEYISHVTWDYGFDEHMFGMLDNLYYGLDLNHDHHVDTADFDLLFNIYDRNHDGQVTKTEFTSFFANFLTTIVG